MSKIYSVINVNGIFRTPFTSVGLPSMQAMRQQQWTNEWSVKSESCPFCDNVYRCWTWVITSSVNTWSTRCNENDTNNNPTIPYFRTNVSLSKLRAYLWGNSPNLSRVHTSERLSVVGICFCSTYAQFHQLGITREPRVIPGVRNSRQRFNF